MRENQMFFACCSLGLTFGVLKYKFLFIYITMKLRNQSIWLQHWCPHLSPFVVLTLFHSAPRIHRYCVRVCVFIYLFFSYDFPL